MSIIYGILGGAVVVLFIILQFGFATLGWIIFSICLLALMSFALLEAINYFTGDVWKD